jgi:glycine/D-amino acid oxidase-like deaminating enzyme
VPPGRTLWRDEAGPAAPRPPLDGDTDVDVAIVGGGFTGLWTAWYLLARDPHMRVVVVEREHVGFGASGRNGGWCVGEMAAGFDALARIGGRDGALRQVRAVMDTVDEVGRVVTDEGIDCAFTVGGTVRLARNGAQLIRQSEEIEHHRALGFGPEVLRSLDRDEAADRVRATNVRGGLFFTPSAVVQPLRLVRGLARAVEGRGGWIVEATAARELSPGLVRSDRGSVRADVVVRATEGYTSGLPGEGRRLLPLYSLMVATEPLSADQWDAVGLAHRETFADDRHLVIYGQRTADDRIAFGGRGAPYAYASRVDAAVESSSRIHGRVTATLRELFPQLGGVGMTHHWGGVLGVPRDWIPSVGLDRATGLAWAGGYVGEGVAASNLAGRTLADLITGATSELTDLPWVGHRSRRWEPEPLRWLGVNAGLALSAATDRAENRTDRPTRRGRALARFVG